MSVWLSASSAMPLEKTVGIAPKRHEWQEYSRPGWQRQEERLVDEPIGIVIQDEDVAEHSFAILTRDNNIVIGHSLVSPIPAGAENLSCTVICREPVDIAMPDSHRLANSATIRPRDLIGESWISVPVGFPLYTVLQTIEQMTDSSATIVQRVRDIRVVESLVIAGLGIALLPRFTTRQRDGLVLRPIMDIPAQRWVVAMSRPDWAERAVVRPVMEVLHSVGALREGGGPGKP